MTNNIETLCQMAQEKYQAHIDAEKQSKLIEQQTIELAFEKKGITLGKTIVICKETGRTGVLKLSEKHIRKLIHFFSIRFYPLTKSGRPGKGSSDEESSLLTYTERYRCIRRDPDAGKYEYADEKGNSISEAAYYAWKITSTVNSYEPTKQTVDD